MNFIVRLSVNFTLFSIVSSERQQKIAEEFLAALFLRVENDRKIGCLLFSKTDSSNVEDNDDELLKNMKLC